MSIDPFKNEDNKPDTTPAAAPASTVKHAPDHAKPSSALTDPDGWMMNPRKGGWTKTIINILLG